MSAANNTARTGAVLPRAHDTSPPVDAAPPDPGPLPPNEALLGCSLGRPDAAALIDARGRTTEARDIEAQRLCLAAFLRSRGVARGDRAVVFLSSPAKVAAVVGALVSQGVVAVFCDPALGLAEIAAILRSVEPRILFGTWKAHLALSGKRAYRRIPNKIFRSPLPLPGVCSFRGALRAAGECSSFAFVRDRDPALITYTTGTTGRPKGVVRTYGILRSQHELIGRHLSRGADGVEMNNMPMFLLHNLISGTTTVLPSRNPRRMIDQIRRLSVRRCILSPGYFRDLAEHASAGGVSLEGVKLVCTGGAAVGAALFRKAKAVFPRAEILYVYGSTEAEPISMISADELLADCFPRTGSGAGVCVGKPIGEARVGILPETPPPQPATKDPRTCFLARNGVGELVVAGSHVARCYYRDETSTMRIKIRDADGEVWHRTGDLGYLDRENRIWLLGRVRPAAPGHPAPPGRETSHPYRLEPAVDELAPVRRSALVDVARRGKLTRVLAVQPATPRGRLRAGQRSRILGQLSRTITQTGVGVDAVVFLKKLPLDARHRFKIRREKLQRRIAAGGRLYRLPAG